MSALGADILHAMACMAAAQMFAMPRASRLQLHCTQRSVISVVTF